MYIGTLSRLTGASQKAIRHFEALGLLGPVRRAGAYRVYGEEDVARVRLIRQAQGLGFRLVDLQPLLAGDEPDWAGVARQVTARRQAVAREIRRLQALDQELQQIHGELQACLAGAEALACSVAGAAPGRPPAP